MAERSQPEGSEQLSERVQKYRKEVQALVNQGGEQPQFEFKRTASLTRENLDDRLGFIKLLQGLANAEIVGERCIAIGADPKQKKFFPVSNLGDFDAAKISQILTAYVEPLPHFNVNRSHKPSRPNGCLFASGHLRSAVDICWPLWTGSGILLSFAIKGLQFSLDW